MKQYLTMFILFFVGFRLGDELCWIAINSDFIIPLGPITDMVAILLFLFFYFLIDKTESK